MAWRSHGRTNADLVRNLEKNRIFTSPRVREAMLAVDRGDFTKIDPYQDSPQGIGCRATISAPHMHAAALEALSETIGNAVKSGQECRVLDVGSGSGYLTACLAVMAGPTSKVVGIEHIGQLVNDSLANLKKHHSDMLASGRLQIIEGDGRVGYPQLAPYDAIHVGAASPQMPTDLISQLKIGGRMVVPVGVAEQRFLQVDRINETDIATKTLMDVIYVPLTDKAAQMCR
uniref:Protein-L-isoaspartate O-methyltransferase n=1 Tax=Panagrellus redivivus TaxID=6233 RepID=A0A7E4WC88_PANRE